MNQLFNPFSLMDLPNHKWNKHSEYESLKIIEILGLRPNEEILDVGCGSGRHSLEFSKKGIFSTGLDNAIELLQIARNNESKDSIFIELDVSKPFRFINKNREKYLYDGIICLYDVIGSSIELENNIQILENCFNHLKSTKKFLLSVLNFEYTKKIAKLVLSSTNLKLRKSQLESLESSLIMESTGDIFNPEFFALDDINHIVYRKEKFSSGFTKIIRDKRFSKNEIKQLCEFVGFEVLWMKSVKLGNWDEENENGKEILVCCKKP